MKRVLNKALLCGLLVVCLAAMLSMAAYFTGPSDVFIDVCDHLFTEGSGYIAIDKNGGDVTDQFVRDYRDAYLSGNFEAIFEAVSDDLSCITWKEDDPQESVVANGKVNQHFYKTAEAGQHMPSTTVEVEFQVAGYFDYCDETGQIYKDSLEAYLNVNHIGAGTQHSGKQNNISTNWTLGPDEKSVAFTGKFDVAVDYTILGFVIRSENITFNGEVTGYSH